MKVTEWLGVRVFHMVFLYPAVFHIVFNARSELFARTFFRFWIISFCLVWSVNVGLPSRPALEERVSLLLFHKVYKEKSRINYTKQ